MPTETVDIREAQARLPELVSLAEAGTEVILVRNETPLVRLVPVSQPSSGRVPGLHAGAISTSNDFDAPLPDEFWTGRP
ncbi:MAG: toxin-antitoxin (TA) system antitoxin [Gemmatimonadetes bacterium]|jgi:antitoxin (DNA-binding transcriptional repressor) of toxin-antitoxin stability system|nr:toxin-antitoxin (TA) system antitoxin [Gemmatimonadota bacterium]